MVAVATYYSLDGLVLASLAVESYDARYISPEKLLSNAYAISTNSSSLVAKMR